MDSASEAVLALKPVTFRYKKDIDPEQTPHFGLIAEDVEKVNPDLVIHDREGKPHSVRYEQINAMLVNEFLKEHRTVKAQQNEIDALRQELKAQRALIEKVNARIDKAAPQLVVDEL
jgi:ABC-type hemin transport system substrate-binding protein